MLTLTTSPFRTIAICPIQPTGEAIGGHKTTERCALLRMIVSAAVFLASCAIGLLVAKFTLDGMTIKFGSFLIVVVIFAILQAILAPFIAKMVHRNASALVGGVGLFSTFIALLIASLVSSGLTIRGAGTWVLACVIVWLVTMLATLFLPLIFVKKHLRQRAAER